MNEEKLIKLIDKNNWDLAGDITQFRDDHICYMRSIQNPKLVVSYPINITLVCKYLTIFYDKREIGSLSETCTAPTLMKLPWTLIGEKEEETNRVVSTITLAIFRIIERFENIRLYNDEEKAQVIDALLNPPAPFYKEPNYLLCDGKGIPGHIGLPDCTSHY